MAYPHPEVVAKAKPDLLRRLRRIEGQARGIARMLEEGRDCGEIVTQVAAMKAATEQVGVAMIACLMEAAVRSAVHDGEDSRVAVELCTKLLAKL